MLAEDITVWNWKHGNIRSTLGGHCDCLKNRKKCEALRRERWDRKVCVFGKEEKKNDEERAG